MTNLEPQADKAVRDAVDAFMEGRLNPEFAGETVFETKNSRYRLLDGVVFAAPVDTLIGAELVGWLMETTRRSVVGSAWQPGARAVLVDRHRGRNIIVTSTTRLLHLEAPPSSEPARPVAPPSGGWIPPSGHAVAPPSPEYAPPPQRPRVIPSTPPPPQVLAPAPPPAAVPRPSPVQSAAIMQKRAAAVHLPPRPIAAGNPTPLPVPSRPLPMPAPPPRRDLAADPPAPFAMPEPPAGWELTSSEFELEGEPTQDDDDNPTRHDAPRYPDDDATDELLEGPESGADAPILLTRPIFPGAPGGQRSPT